MLWGGRAVSEGGEGATRSLEKAGRAMAKVLTKTAFIT